MSRKAQSMAVASYTPGPDQASPARGGAAVKGTPTDLTTKIGSGMPLAAPVQQFTPSQQFFRDNAAGRWQADYDTGAHAPVNSIRQDKGSGAVDVVRLEPSHNPGGVDSYLDLGGHGGRDYAARRP